MLCHWRSSSLNCFFCPWFFRFCSYRNGSRTRRRNRDIREECGGQEFAEINCTEWWRISGFCSSSDTIAHLQVWFSQTIFGRWSWQSSLWFSKRTFCMPGNHLNCHFPQRPNYHDRLFSLLGPHLGCILAKYLESQIFHNLSPSLRRNSKPSQKMRCLRFFGAIALPPVVASRLLLPTVRGCLLLTVISDRPLVEGVAGSWYCNPSHHFLLLHLSIRCWCFHGVEMKLFTILFKYAVYLMSGWNFLLYSSNKDYILLS